MYAKLALSPWLDDSDEGDMMPPRLALAGGSNQRPPDDHEPRGQVVPFPRKPARPLPDEPAAACTPEFSREPDASPGDGVFWAEWLSGVLSTRSTVREMV
ncbi:MAG: hypothetical protein FJX54_22980 [Alphaproteobacteria bacterium]|nr:hypothetical protein [Alphaproteobacteria bacterium]